MERQEEKVKKEKKALFFILNRAKKSCQNVVYEAKKISILIIRVH